MSADITSEVTIIQKLSMISYSVEWTGTAPVGNLYIQVSNDYSLFPDGEVNNPGTWNNVPVTVTGAIPISGNADNGFIDITEISAYAMRLFYDATSGIGTMNAVATGKVA